MQRLPGSLDRVRSEDWQRLCDEQGRPRCGPLRATRGCHYCGGALDAKGRVGLYECPWCVAYFSTGPERCRWCKSDQSFLKPECPNQPGSCCLVDPSECRHCLGFESAAPGERGIPCAGCGRRTGSSNSLEFAEADRFADYAVAVLNSMLELDPEATQNLTFGAPMLCNQELADHPSVQVLVDTTKWSGERFLVRGIGLINGVIPPTSGSWGRVCGIFTYNCELHGERETDGPCSECGHRPRLRLLRFARTRPR